MMEATDRCSGKSLGDIGDGVIVELRYVDGVLHGIEWQHPDPHRPSQRCNGLAWVSLKPMWSDGWDLLSLDPLTLSPSLLCQRCGRHGFIRDGRWVPA